MMDPEDLAFHVEQAHRLNRAAVLVALEVADHALAMADGDPAAATVLAADILEFVPGFVAAEMDRRRRGEARLTAAQVDRLDARARARTAEAGL